MANPRIKKLQQQLEAPLLITNHQDLFYLTGYFFADGGYLLITSSQSVLLGGYLEDTKGLQTDSFKNLSKYLKRSSHIYIDDSTSLRDLKLVKKYAPKIQLKAVTSPVKALRLIKSADELIKMKQAYEITAKVFGQVKRQLRTKDFTEIELAQFIRLAGLKLGADDISFPVIVASGANAAIPHHVPTNKKLKTGESIILDFGFKIDGYCSDFTRTVFIKSVSKELRKIYIAAEQAQWLGITAVHEGASAKEIDLTARNFLQAQGYGKYFIHTLGHGTGLDVHEKPNLHPHSSDTLTTGMVFSIEPGIYIPRVGGVRIEDLVYVKNNKANLFYKVSTKLEDMIIK